MDLDIGTAGGLLHQGVWFDLVFSLDQVPRIDPVSLKSHDLGYGSTVLPVVLRQLHSMETDKTPETTGLKISSVRYRGSNSK